MQEAYLRILRLKRPGKIRSPKAYLYRVTANIAYQHPLSCNKGSDWVPFKESEEIHLTLVSARSGEAQCLQELTRYYHRHTGRQTDLPCVLIPTA
jgi:hypothetical protein